MGLLMEIVYNQTYIYVNVPCMYFWVLELDNYLC